MTIVTIKLTSPDGLPLAGAEVSAIPHDVIVTYPDLVMPSRVDARTSSTGECRLTLRPSYAAGEGYAITVRHRAIQTRTVHVVVPNVSSITLAELLGAVNPFAPPVGALVTSGGHLVLSTGTLVFA